MYYKNWPKMLHKGLILFVFGVFTLFLSGCFKEATKVGVVYFNDFEDYNLKDIEVFGFSNNNWSQFKSISIVDFDSTKVLGRFNNGQIILKLHKLPTHQAINIQFDLLIHDNWRNDAWVLELEKVRRLVTGFSNDPDKWQSYPNWIGNGSPLNPPGANSFTKNLPGACRWVTNPNGTSMYKMERTEIHSDSTFTISCSDAGEFFNLNCDRSWSIDNLKISIINNQ